jgi:hypothetical protein
MPAEAVTLTELLGAEKAKLAVMEISEPYEGPDGEAYILRVTACQPNHEPASLEEVRDRVLADIRLARAYEIARETGKKLLEAAQAKDLAEAAKAEKIKTADSDWVPQEHLIPVPYAGQFFAFPASLPEVGSNRVVLNECFRMAAEGKKLTLVSLAEEQMVVVAQLLGRKPPREAKFLLMRPLLAQQTGWQLGGAALRQAVDLSAIQRRLSVVLSAPEDAHLPRGSRDVADDDL